MQGIGNDYAHAKGISNDQALREVMSAGIGGSLFGAKGSIDGSYQDGVSKSESDNLMSKTFDSESFQKHLQTIKNASHGEVASVLGSEDARLHEDFSKSFNRTEATSEQLRAAYTEQEALSTLKSYSSSEDVRIHQNLNQRFVEFLAEKYQDLGKVNNILEMPSESPEKRALIQEFAKDFTPHHHFDIDQAAIKSSYNDNATQVTQVSEDQFQSSSAAFHHSGEEKIGFRYGEIKAQVSEFQTKVLSESQHDTNVLTERKDKIEQTYQEKKNSSHEAVDTSTLSHFIDKSITSNVIAKAVSINSYGNIYQQLFGSSDQPTKPSE